MENLIPWIPYLAGIGGLLAGIAITWFALQGSANTQIARYQERLKSSEKAFADLEAGCANLEAEVQQLRHSEAVSLKRQAELEVLGRTQQKAVEEKQQLLRDAELRLAKHFKALSSEALKTTQTEFLKLAQANFASQQKEATSELEQRRVAVETLVRPVAATLDKVEHRIGDLERARADSDKTLTEQVRQMAAAQMGLQQETSQLCRALRQPVGRGRWGEVQLKRVVEMAGMQAYCDFIDTTSEQTANTPHRPDLIVKLPTGRQIAVDARAPLDAGLDALESTDEAAHQVALKRHAARIADHITELASPAYRDQFVKTPEFVVLFLPSESFLSAALSQNPALLERGIESGVILATPTTLVALLRAAAVGWQQEDVAAKARSVSEVGRELFARVSSLADHVTRVGQSLDTTVRHYNQTVGALESDVLPNAKRLSALGAAPEGLELPSSPLVDRAVRPSRPDRSRLPLTSEPKSTTSNDASSNDSFEGFAEPGPEHVAPGKRPSSSSPLSQASEADSSHPASEEQPDPGAAAGDLRAALAKQRRAG